MDACRLAGAGDDEPVAEDLVEGLQQLLRQVVGDSILVLDDPFTGVAPAVRGDLLEVVRAASATRPLALLTEDADTLGWAIELPVEEATAVPADALVNSLQHVSETRAETAGVELSSGGAVDITTPDSDPEPAPTVPRWAGQR
jgi:hypothetical protein